MFKEQTLLGKDNYVPFINNYTIHYVFALTAKRRLIKMEQNISKQNSKKKSNLTGIIIISVVLVLTIIAAIIIVSNASGGGKVSGIYADNSGNYLKFNENDQVTIFLTDIGISVPGTYTINGNQIVVEYDFNLLGHSDAKVMNGIVSADKRTITLDGSEYTKA
ncbi:MAG: hypothetical protein FWH37_02475 [Candidatus Bathyarchaeota archaeon]|nr:hypothetical protein [Candidatus Termiticorpusculum sp.]